MWTLAASCLLPTNSTSTYPLPPPDLPRRCGDLDPAAVLYMVSEMGMSPAEVDNLMNKKSGLVGVCGEKDFRSILQGIAAGDKKAELAHDLFVQR